MNIIKDFIKPGRRNRPMTNPESSLHGKTMEPEYITIHNAYSRARAERLHEYVKSQGAADRPASWHFSVDETDIYQALPLAESGWHAGDNLGPGNTTTIGIEICDYAMLKPTPNKVLFWEACENAARLCAYLIKNVPSLKPFPECLKQHNHWSGKNCPSFIRAEPGGWAKFLDMVGEYLKIAEITEPEAYRVVVASNTDYDKSVEDLRKAQKAFPTQIPIIRLNKHKGEKYYRVVLAELDKIAVARALMDKARERLQSGWIVSDWNDLPFDAELEEPETEPEGTPEGISGPGSSGLMKLLKDLYKLLHKIFGGGD